MPRLNPDQSLAAPTALRARTMEQSRRAATRATAKANRRRSWPRWAGRALRWSMAMTVTVALAAAGTVLWRQGWVGRETADAGAWLIRLSAGAGLALRDVQVEGRVETDRDQILAALKIRRGDPILLFDPDGARAGLERLPWVASATVERRLPDTLFISLTERRPMALWQQHDKKLALVDFGGVVLTDRALDRFARLPILVGDDAPQEAPALLTLLAAEPDLAKRVEAAVRVGGRRWNLRLDNGVDIRLPESGIAVALHTLTEMEHRQPFLDKDVVAVDLRVPDRVEVQTGPVSGQRRRTPEKPEKLNKT